MADTLFERNAACLPTDLKELLARDNPETALSPEVRVIVGRGGLPVAVIEGEGGTVHTNSLVDPQGEAERWAESIAYKDMRACFLYGCGFGYPLLEYAKRKREYTETVVFEHSIPLFRAMLQHLDMRPLLRDTAIRFVVGDKANMMAQLSRIVTGEFLLRSTMLSYAFTWTAHRSEKQTYMELHEQVWGLLDLCALSIGNTVHDSLAGLYNTLENAGPIIRSPGLPALRDAFAGQPAFIVANGPSLDKNAHWLEKAVGRSLLLTAESALLPCLKRNIRPDAVCVTERNPLVYHVHFAEERLPEELVMIGLTVVDPRIPRQFEGRWLPVFRKHEVCGHWVRDAIADSDAGLLGGSSSAHLAFEAAIWLGADPIVFVGQDLAFGPDKITHSKLSAYAGERLAGHVEALQKQEAFQVPGMDGNPVWTTKAWNDYRLWFEHQISLYPGRTFIDATEGGARIRGTKAMTLREAVGIYCAAQPARRLYEHVRSAHPVRDPDGEARKLERLLHGIGELRSHLGQLEQAADTDLRNCRLAETAAALHAKYPAAPLPAFAGELIGANADAYRRYAQDMRISVFIQHVVFAYHKQINDLGEIDTPERLGALTALHSGLLATLKAVFEKLGQQFEAAEIRLRRQADERAELADR